MRLLFEDDALLVCAKPAGLLSQADNNGKENAVSLLAGQTGGDIYPVHRLDRTTGGLMVFAKTKQSAACLSGQIAEHDFCKEYLARVHGIPQPVCGTMTDLLFYDRRAGKTYVVKRRRGGVKEAVLSYETIETAVDTGDTTQTISLVKIRLQTGRTHQIRAQFASRGMPLAGDRRYGAKDAEKEISLWSYRLEFTHPVTGKQMEFMLEPQKDS